MTMPRLISERSYDDITYRTEGGRKDSSGSLSPFTFLCISLVLTLMGLVSLYSASYAKAVDLGLPHYWFFMRQAIVAAVSLGVGAVFTLIPRSALEKGYLLFIPLSLALLDRYDPASLPAWLRKLRRVRYRGGKIDGYASRLHYSTDWLHEMCREGILRDMTRELGGIPFPGQVGLITATADKRPAFRDDTSQLSKMRAVERAINGREKLYIPRGRVTPELCQKIQDGDIILFTTDKKGLDTAHVGIACRRNGATRVMHASLGKREITVSQESLAGYLEKIPSHSGIIIARLNY